jgi:lipopolysaccharide/colanic/teichoic acid biosynthesis glycosyltransferase
MIKRLFDIIISLIGLLVLSPILVVLGFLILLLMSWPIFYIQIRVGKYGKEFKMLKYRTMILNPTKQDSSFDLGDKSRITSFGKLLRKTKIDEFPQLLNVLAGDMSFVGPRPEVKKWTEVYPEKWAIVHTVRPGITDNASIEFRNEEALLSESLDPEQTYHDVILPHKLDLYIDYVNNHSFAGDILIILRTIKTILFR